MLVTTLLNTPHVEQVSTESSTFLHYLLHPSHSRSSTSLCLRKIPKNHQEHVDSLSVPPGWGIQIVEGLDFASVLYFAFGYLIVLIPWIITLRVGIRDDIIYAFIISYFALFTLLWVLDIRGGQPTYSKLHVIAQWLSVSSQKMKSSISDSLKAKRIYQQKNDIIVAGGEEHSIGNKLKLWVEDTTGQRWDWWPFAPRFLLLRSDQARIKFQCVSFLFDVLMKVLFKANFWQSRGCIHWLDVLKSSLPPSKTHRGDSFNLKTLTSNSSSSEGSNDDFSQSVPSDQETSFVTSDGKSTPSPEESTIEGDMQDSRGQQPPLDNNGNCVNIIPSSQMEGFVLIFSIWCPFPPERKASTNTN
jgi:hypothetical protein